MSEQIVPFITILQGLNPQINPSKPEYVEGAMMGMLFNTATKEVFNLNGMRGLAIMPVWRERQFTEWVPRDDITYADGSVIKGSAGGGGFRGIHDPNSPEVLAATEKAIKIGGRAGLFKPLPHHNDDTNEDTVLIDQYNLGVLYGYPELNEHTMSRAMVAFSSTKINVYRAFIALVNGNSMKYPNPRTGLMALPPMWAHRWRLGVVSQTNKKGDFFNYRLDLEKQPKEQSMVKRTDPTYLAASEFFDQWSEGRVRGDYETADKSGGAGQQQGGTAPIDPDSQHIPF